MTNAENETATDPADAPAPEIALAPPVAPASTDTPNTVEDLQTEIAALRAEISALHAVKEAASVEEVLILEKMRYGLTRPQATAVVRRQAAFDNSPHGKMCRARFEARQSFKASA